MRMFVTLILLLGASSVVYPYRLFLFMEDEQGQEIQGYTRPKLAATEHNHIWGIHQPDCAWPEGAAGGDCFPPIFWDCTDTIRVNMGHLTDDVDQWPQVAAVAASIDTWGSALDSLGAAVALEFGSYTGDWFSMADSLNTVVFVDFEELGSSIGMIVFRVRTEDGPAGNSGSIIEADILLNDDRYVVVNGDTVSMKWTLNRHKACDSGDSLDIQSVVTHEVGHLLGLAHTCQSTVSSTCESMPTMLSGGDSCNHCPTEVENLEMRMLAQDDINGLSELYGPGNNDSTYVWLLAGVCSPGQKRVTAGVSSAPTGPVNVGVVTTYPNPFNPEVTIRIDLVRSDAVALRIYNQRGQLIDELLADAPLRPGRHEVRWSPRERGLVLGSGVYYVSVEGNHGSRVHRMVLIQ